MKKAISLIITAIMIFAALFMAVSAAEDVPSKTISISIDGAKASQKCSFEIKADKEGSPLPKNTIVSITGEGSAAFEEIEFPDRIAEYTYTISQIPGDDPLCVYDKIVYSVTANVLRNENDEYFAVYTIKNSDGEKISTAKFNVKWNVEENDLPKTGGESTWLYSLIGILGVAVASFVFITVFKRKESINEK